MERREAIKWVASFFGGTLIGSEAFLSGCTSNSETIFFSADEMNLLDEIGETILPETSKSPGAKAAKIAEFMQKIVRDCYSAEEQAIFRSGLSKLDEKSDQDFGSTFRKLTTGKRIQILEFFEIESKEKSETVPPHFFTFMRQLTIWGYFTSEVGATQALRYDPIPGTFEGCLELEPDQPAWY